MHPVQVFELIVGMILAVLLLHYVASRLSLPPAVALLVGGGALAFIPGLPAITPDPEPAHYDVILAVVAAGRAELVRLHRMNQIDDETLPVRDDGEAVA